MMKFNYTPKTLYLNYNKNFSNSNLNIMKHYIEIVFYNKTQRI